MAFGKFNRLSQEQNIRIPTRKDLEKPLIMVIDDDIHIRQMLSLALQKQYTVLLCASGRDGIARLSRDVHTLILDIKMPGEDGFQVYDAITPQFPDLPIIFYSAYQDVLEGAKLSLKYKPFNYVDKSSDIQELFNTLERAVASYKRIVSINTLTETITAKTAKTAKR